MNKYTSRNGQITLSIVGYDEPNNGRELHVAELYVNGEDCTATYFKEGWNRLNFNLSALQFEGEQADYIFVPAEGYSFLVQTTTFDKYYLPYKGLSTLKFIKNEFVGSSLIVYYTDEQMEIDLKNLPL